MTTKEFIKKAQNIHNNKYNYSKTIYVNSKTKIVLECPVHGEITQNPRAHLNSCGCQYCASNKITTTTFINKSNEIHDFLYSYNKSIYVSMRKKLKIKCKIHGIFEQEPRAHLAGQGCPKCGLLSPKRYKKDLNHFIDLANNVHNNFYDYSKTIYENSKTKVIITCPIHGDFKQRASAHTSGQKCPKCSISKPITTKEFIRKAQNIHNNKYDYSKTRYINANTKLTIICPNHGEFKQKATAHINSKNGCPKCGYESMQSTLLYSTPKFIKLSKNIHGDKYDYSKTEYEESKKKLKIVCQKHGEFYQRPNDHLNGNGCPKCAGTRLQNEIFKFVSSLSPDSKYNNRSIIKPYELDIFIPSKKIGIEVNGIYWHSFNHIETTEERNRHTNKCDLCVNYDIFLIQINENEWRNKQKIIKSILKSKLGIIPNKIYARKCKIIKLDSQQHKKFMDQNHIQGGKGYSVAYGLSYKDELVTIMSFNKHKKYEWEITRFANKLNTMVVGGASRLFKRFIKENNPDQILTYADRRYSNGNLYKKLGFKLDGVTKPNYCYVKRDKIYSRQQFMKHKLKDKLETFDPKLTEAQNMFNNGYRRLWDAGNYRFLLK